MRRGRRHARIAAAAAVLCLALVVGAWFSVRAVASRRMVTMRVAADAAGSALRAARAEDAMHWAPAELAAAEKASRDALTSQRVQQVRAWPIPDAATVVAEWSAAERAARAAASIARDRHAAGVTSAIDEIERAHQSVADSEAVAATIYLGPDHRLLATARTALDEARTYQRAGDVNAALARARDAATLARQATDRAADRAARFADAATRTRWQRWKDDAIAWSKREGRAAIVVVKDAHLLTVYMRGEAVRSYHCELGFNWIEGKRLEGDGATPEGRYRVVARMDHAGADLYKAMLIDYPNADDRAEFERARRSGEIPSWSRIGGLIEIHGGGGRQKDWTNGCVALTNRELDDLLGRVSVGTPVTIVGSDSYGPIAEFADRHKRDAAGRRP